MSILQIHKLFASSHEGWDAFARIQASSLKLFVFLVVPFSLIPPLMLEYAGGHIGAAMFPDTSAQAWSTAALFFLIAELITVPLMAWAIKSVANSKGALFSDQIVLIVAIAILGLAASVTLIFRGAESILKVEEGLDAFDIAYVVTALGLSAWALLIMLGLVPALA